MFVQDFMLAAQAAEVRFTGGTMRDPVSASPSALLGYMQQHWAAAHLQMNALNPAESKIASITSFVDNIIQSWSEV